MCDFDNLEMKMMDFVDATGTGDEYAIGDSLTRISDWLLQLDDTDEKAEHGMFAEIAAFCWQTGVEEQVPGYLGECSIKFLTAFVGSSIGDAFVAEYGTRTVKKLLSTDNPTRYEMELMASLIANQSEAADLVPLDMFSGELNTETALLFEAFCRMTTAPLPSLIRIIICAIGSHGCESAVTRCMFESLQILRKRFDLTEALVEHNFYSVSAEWFPLPQDCLCLMLTLHSEALQDGIATPFLSWPLFTQILQDRSISVDLVTTTLWALHVFVEACTDEELQAAPLDIVPLLSSHVHNVPYESQKHTLLAYATLRIRLTSRELADPDLIGLMSDIADLEEDDADFVASLQLALESFTND